MIAFKRLSPALFAALALSPLGCGQGDAKPAGSRLASPAPAASAPIDAGKYVLAAAPADAKNVIEVRKQAKDGDEVVLIGRIGGSGKPFTGRAAFTIVDLSLMPDDEDGCGNPWCSVDPKELKAAVTLVRFTDENGKTLPTDARQLFGAQMLQTVVVKGQAKRDESGSFMVIARGIHLKPLEAAAPATK